MDRECSIQGCDRPVIAGGICTSHYNRIKRHGDPHHGGELPKANWGACQVAECNNAAGSSGMCPPHEARAKRYGNPEEGRRAPGTEAPECAVDGCERPARAQGFCQGHHKRLRIYGDVMATKPFRVTGGSATERFWGHVQFGNDRECWPWQAGTDPKGYGRFQLESRKTHQAHRVAYVLEHGPIPLDYQVHHLCENKGCCNPTHLTALPAGEHTLLGNGFSGTNARKTHCKRGHPLTPENCYDYPGKRECKICAKMRVREQRRRKL